MMVATITRAIRAERVAVKRLAKKAGLADRAVSGSWLAMPRFPTIRS
jgi:hypothetical protein